MITKKAYVKGGGKLTDEIYLSLDRKCAQKKKTLTEEHKDKISDTLKGHKQSEEHKLHKSEYMKNHPEAWMNNIVVAGDTLDEDHKRKISKSLKGNQNKKGKKKGIEE